MNKNNVNISKKVLQSMTAAVCAWTILLGLVAPGMAAETEVPAIQESVLLETTAKTTAEAVTEEDNSGTTQDLLATLRGEIATYMDIYQISPEMPDSALANAYFILDSAEAKAAWDTAHTLMDKAAELSDEDTAALMADINTKLCLRFYGIMAQINNPAMAAEYTTIPRLTITDTGSGAEVTTNSLKASVAGSKDSCGNAKEASRTITLKNSSGSVGTLSFDWKVEGNASSFTITKSDGSTITATSGTGFSDDLAANASVTITFKAKGEGNTANLLLTAVKLMPAASASNITFQYDTAYGSVKQGSASVENGGTVSIEAHTEFAATPANGAKFVAWLDDSNKILGVNSTLLVEASGDQSICALFVHPTKSNAWFDPGNGYLYSDWDTAFANGSVVAIACDGLLPTESHTVVSGKTLLIPYNNANTVITTNMEDYDILPADAGAQTLYRQLIMPSGASITVQDGGSLNVGSRASRQMTGQVGAYGAIKMDSGSSITIASGATMYAWGYLFHGDNGSGTVTIENGGIVYETLMSMDYPGSASTTNTLYNDGIFPLRTFTVRNVEVPMTLEYGAEEQCFFHFYGTNVLVGDNPGYVSLIGNDSTFTFQMENGTEIVKSYTNSRQKFSVNGSASLNAIAITVKSTDITSTQTSGFPVPSGYDIEIASGTFKLNENVILMEGSTLTIANGAFADINGKNVYIFDADDDAGSVSATDVHSVAYTLVAEDAIIDINGTLIASGGFYTSTDKTACITSSEGTGIITASTTSSAESVYIKTGRSAATPYTINPAKLLNSDGSYVATAGSDTSTYKYQNGYWHIEGCIGFDNGTVTTAAKCETAGVKTFTCTCGNSYTETIPALVHSFTTEVANTRIPATCAATGSVTMQCANTGCTQTQVQTLGIDPDNHTGETYLSGKVDATCTEPGYSGDTHCGGCKKKLSDGNTVSAIGHTPAAAVQENVKKATCLEPGSYDSVIYCSVSNCGAELSRTTISVPAAGHTYVDGKCSVCGCVEVSFTIAHNLALKELVQIGYWVKAESTAEIKDVGILIWKEADYFAEDKHDISSDTAVNPAMTSRQGFMMGYGEGIYAQYLDTKYYAVPYVVTSDGSYVYSGTPDVYAAPTYALQMGNQPEKVKTVVRDLLNYGTYAQLYFDSRPDGDIDTSTRINDVLEDAQKKLRYSDTMLVEEITADKTAENTNLPCTWRYSTAELLDAIQLNFFADRNSAFTNMLHWNETDYTAANTMKKDNATTVLNIIDKSIVKGDDTVCGSISGIYPKNLTKWHYACMYNSADNTYGPLRVDSVACYLSRMISNLSQYAGQESEYGYLLETCKAMLAYGDSAKAYAGS